MDDQNIAPEYAADSGVTESNFEPPLHATRMSGMNNRWLRRASELTAVALLPAILFHAYGVEKFYLLSGADPFIYAGYTVRLKDLIQRFGYPYYAVRFGLILPSVAATRILGVVGGYFGLRWSLSALAAITLYYVLRQRYRWEIGFSSAIVFLLNPMFIRAEMTVYSTTTGVPTAAIGCMLLLVGGSRRGVRLYRLIAGFAFGLCINSNPFTILPITAAVSVWIFARWLKVRKSALIELGFIISGVTLVCLVGVLIYGVRFGHYDILSPSLKASRSLTAQVPPGSELNLSWLGFRPEIWLPVFASMALIISLKLVQRPSKWFEIAAASMPMAMWLSYAIHEFVMNGYELENYFYTSYMYGPSAMALAMALGVLNELWGEKVTRARCLMVAILALSVPVMWTHLTPHLSVWTLTGVVPVVALTVLALLSSPRFFIARIGILVTVTLIPFLLTLGTPRNVSLAVGQQFRQDPKYFQVFNHYDDSKFDVYLLATDFTRVVPLFGQDPGGVVFWLSPTDDVAVLAQWTYLGPYSSLRDSSSPSLPGLDAGERARLKDRTPHFLVVMGSEEQTVVDGEAAVRQLGLPIVGVRSARFQRGFFHLFTRVIELVPASCDLSDAGHPVQWQSLGPCSGP